MTDAPRNDPWSNPSQNQPAPGYGGPSGGPGGSPDYGGPSGYGAPPPRQASNGIGIAALVVGIVALLLSWIPFLGLLLAIAAVVLGIIGIRKASRGEATNKGMAITGVVTGGLALVIGAFFTIIIVGLFSSDEFQNVFECLQDAQTVEEQEACNTQFQNDLGR